MFIIAVMFIYADPFAVNGVKCQLLIQSIAVVNCLFLFRSFAELWTDKCDGARWLELLHFLK